MGIFNITWASGLVERVEQSDCHDVEMFLNTKFGGGTTKQSLAENGVTVDQVIEPGVLRKLLDSFEDVVDDVKEEVVKVEDKVESFFGRRKEEPKTVVQDPLPTIIDPTPTPVADPAPALVADPVITSPPLAKDIIKQDVQVAQDKQPN